MDTVVPNNPYVGPRSIKTGEAFFGRDREIRSLAALLIAERIVLLHSPSGAGKSSLIQAGLIPRMSERFSVLPLVRVNLEAPEEVRGMTGLNRYVLSTLLSLEEGLPPEKRLPLLELATLSLDAYLEQRALPAEAPENCLLLFDQFEEILTVSPTDAPAKQAFFEQLGEALQNRRRWALFAIREDYMGGLAPYVRAIPNRLNVPFRLGLLGPEAARVAIQQPAKNKDVDFTDEAAQKLVDDLRRIQVQQPDGSFITEAGPSVEPVQLQVVCFNLWQSHAADDKIIDENDLQRVGSVDQALANYYANAMRSVAESAKVDERILRQWFDEHLITPEGIRSQVLKGAETSEGLPNIVLRLLENTHLVRGETRAGKTWYELSHDRLVQPVRQDNSAWFEHNLTILQRQAVLWDQQGRNEGLLLRRKALAEAEKEVSGIQLTPDEQAFLDACRVLRKREQQDIRQRQFILAGLVASLVLLIIAIVFGMSANTATQNAEKQAAVAQTAEAKAVLSADAAATAQGIAEIEKQNAVEKATIARAGELASQAMVQREKNVPLSLLLGMEAFKVLENVRTESTLLDGIQTYPYATQYLCGHNDLVTSVAFSPDGKILATGGMDKTIILWDMETYQPIGQPLAGHYGSITTLAFSPDGKILASGSADYNIILWDVETHEPIGKPLAQHDNYVKSTVFSPDGKTLASNDVYDNIILWNVAMRQPIGTSFNGHAFGLSTGGAGGGGADDTWLWEGSGGQNLVFSPDGKILVSGDAHGMIFLWDIKTHKPIKMLDTVSQSERDSALFNPPEATSFTYSPDGSQLVAGVGTTIMLWDTKTYQPIGQPLDGHKGNIQSLSFDKGGSLLASNSYDGTVILWSTWGDWTALTQIQSGHRGATRLVFRPGTNDITLALGSYENTVSIWNVETALWGTEFFRGSTSTPPLNMLPIEKNTRSSVGGDWNPQVVSSFSPDGKTLAITAFGSIINHLHLLDAETLQPVGEPYVKQDFPVENLAFSPDSKILAAGGYKGILLWDLIKQELIGQPFAQQIINLAFTPDGKTLASISGDGVIMLWDTATQNSIGKPIETHTPHQLYFEVAFSPDRKILASGGSNIILWDISTGQPIGKPLTGHAVYNRLAFSPDGKTLAESTGDAIILWDVTTHQTIGQPFIGQGIHGSIAFSPDNKTLAFGNGNTVELWDISTHQPIGQPIAGHVGEVYAVVFSPDGKTLASGSIDSYFLQNLDMLFWLDKICQRTGRNLTQNEWAQYFPNETYRKTCAQWPVHQSVIKNMADETLSNIDDPQKAKTAIDKVAELFKGDKTVKDPISEARQLVRNSVQEKLMRMLDSDPATLNTETIKPIMALLNVADYLGSHIDPYSLNNICWRGNLDGYAKDVLRFCEQAVSLRPGNASYRDSRGLARALTGDFTGAILDFQSYIDELIKGGYREDLVKQRQQWILDLQAGTNPFTPEVLEMLKGQ